jgi:hypothetical protein
MHSRKLCNAETSLDSPGSPCQHAPTVRLTITGLLMLPLAGCAPHLAESPSTHASGYRGAELRRPAVTLRVEIGPELPERDRTDLPALYAGILAEALDAKAISPVDLEVSMRALDRAAALRRARDVQADHVVLVRVTVTRGLRGQCDGRAGSASTMVWTARAEVVRVVDGQPRLSTPTIEVNDLEVECSSTRERGRLGRDEVMGRSARKLVDALLRP